MSNVRVCVIELESKHTLVGYAQVIDVKNDDILIGQQVAYENAQDKIWEVLGAIARDILNEQGT